MTPLAAMPMAGCRSNDSIAVTSCPATTCAMSFPHDQDHLGVLHVWKIHIHDIEELGVQRKNLHVIRDLGRSGGNPQAIRQQIPCDDRAGLVDRPQGGVLGRRHEVPLHDDPLPCDHRRPSQVCHSPEILDDVHAFPGPWDGHLVRKPCEGVCPEHHDRACPPRISSVALTFSRYGNASSYPSTSKRSPVRETRSTRMDPTTPFSRTHEIGSPAWDTNTIA